MAHRFFEESNQSMTGVLNWNEYLEAMKILLTKDLEIKVRMFFKMIDLDGNGSFDYDEVLEICKMSLAKYQTEEGEAFRDEAAVWFADFIFEAFDVTKEDEIPTEVIQAEIFNPASPH